MLTKKNPALTRLRSWHSTKSTNIKVNVDVALNFFNQVIRCERLPGGIAFKEVIQPQVPLGLPCYDFTPVINHKVVTGLPKVSLATSFATYSHGVTGGVYKARERIHRDILIHDY